MTTRWPHYERMIGQPLSALEEETMQRLAAGETYKEIERSSKNVTHQRVARVRAKLGAETTLQAMYLWSQKK